MPDTPKRHSIQAACKKSWDSLAAWTTPATAQGTQKKTSAEPPPHLTTAEEKIVLIRTVENKPKTRRLCLVFRKAMSTCARLRCAKDKVANIGVGGAEMDVI